MTSPTAGPERGGDLIDRLAGNVEFDKNGCWLWMGYIDRHGYGHVTSNGRTQQAHRASYEALVEPIPPELVTDHLCRVRRCVNPDHLEPVTNVENVMRGQSPSVVNAAKTHCNHGHEFSPENTYINADGSRTCRACNRRNVAQYAARKRAEPPERLRCPRCGHWGIPWNVIRHMRRKHGEVVTTAWLRAARAEQQAHSGGTL